MNIKAIILDVDGIIVGEKVGYNFPYPHPEVIKKLSDIHQKGIPISLCTAKPYYAIEQIINDANLNNLHITEGGAVIIDPIDNIVLKKHVIDSKIAAEVTKVLLKSNVYTELYEIDKYVIQEDQQADLTKVHNEILHTGPKVVSSLVDEALDNEIVKIMPVAKNEQDKERVISLFEPFKDLLTLSWGIHPIALPHIFGIVTTKGISKKDAPEELAASENIKLEEILAIGDSTSDWQFIERCGYAGTLQNASEELKKLVSSKNNSFIGKSVDENGILEVFDFFSL